MARRPAKVLLETVAKDVGIKEYLEKTRFL